MANKEHFATLKRGVSTWNIWRKTNPDLRPNLSGIQFGIIDLRGADLHNVDLHDSDLHLATLTDPGVYEATGKTRTQCYRANFRDANMSAACLRGMDLCEADLTRTVLTHSDMGGSDLRNAKLNEADLAGADLTAADLRRAYLHRANLYKADLRGTSLTSADLSGAVLIQTNLVGANLSRADVSNAKFFATIIANVNLTDTHGLDLCSHAGPSVIDHRTVDLSSNLSRKFLQGVGLPEPLINGLPRLLQESSDFCSCFISYSHVDRKFAELLHDKLQETGIRCWLDEEHIFPGDNIWDAIDEGVHQQEKFLICCSKSSLNSLWVDRELEKALQKEEALWHERGRRIPLIIPLDLDGELMRWDGGKASDLKARKAGNFIGWNDNNGNFEGLEGALKDLIVALRRG